MRRYSILFIDDEELMRESFQKLVDWNAHRFDVTGIFKNGENAWEYLENHTADIIITDINMPSMDGISLLEHIRERSLKSRVLFLTGYEYFEYAHKAVQLKAFDFLLKPVTPEILLQAVQRAALDIEKEELSEEAVGKNQEFLQGHFISQLLYGRIKKTEIQKEARKVKIPVDQVSWLVMLAAVDTKEGKKIPEGEGGEVKRLLQEKILEKKQKMEELVGASFQVYFARTVSIHLQMVLTSGRKGLFTLEFIHGFTDSLVALEKELPEYRVTFAVGRSKCSIEELPESFERVRHVADNRHILKGNDWKVVHTSDYLWDKKEELQVVLPTDTLLHHIRLGMIDEVEQDIRGIYEPFRNKEYISLESAKMVTTELAITAFKGEVAFQDESVSYLYYLNHIQQLTTLDEMEEDILQFAKNITEKRKKGGNHKKKTAEAALEYLKHNYMKVELNLNEVADCLNISVPYLAVLFKQETKQNFGAHLLGIRMEKAKELLRTTSDTIGEIAEKTGYSGANYFTVCFKKYMGISPGAYRDQAKDIWNH
ncbi:response regulator [Oribacterium sp. oral taxon 102]|uniref:response regulator transcription factor n=1 Tax=Oribacterium sp. oral taxon 102 TaxID=671214 RepID=UPI0015C04F0A|nr:response regulator [Oribacterium sp. oral taxon 102]NWO20869.1 response regulator [Oribacterium sp. oral taxon 102]